MIFGRVERGDSIAGIVEWVFIRNFNLYKNANILRSGRVGRSADDLST